MAGTRSSSRIASQNSSSPTSNTANSKSGAKRKTDASSSPAAKRGKKNPSKEKDQKTLEETFATEEPEKSSIAPADKSHADRDTLDETEDAAPTSDQNGSVGSIENKNEASKTKEVEDDLDTKMDGTEAAIATDQKNGKAEEPRSGKSKMDDTGEVEPKEDEPKKESDTRANGDTAVETGGHKDDTPSSILEKGIIYFFFRGRVGVDDPHDVNDIARSYMVMRPIAHDAKLGDGPIGEDGNCRLLALPKKVLPLSGKDRFLVFVEKAKTSFKDLKDNILSSSDYETKTAGKRHSPATTPVAEGVYAITTTGRESHLAYILTIPHTLDEVQKDIGLRERGSFITSAKNPQYAGPANASLPQGPEYPQEILDEFRSLRWMPLQPKLLDYVNTQFLIIGDSSGLDNAVIPQPRDEKQDKDSPLAEMEKLEGEDDIRVKHLKGDDAVFADLGLSSQEYPKVPSTW